MPEPNNRLLNSLGLEPEGFDRALSESRPNGALLSRPIMDRSELDSERRWVALLVKCRSLRKIHKIARVFSTYPWCHPWLSVWPSLPTSAELSCCLLPICEVP